ncbi:MAG: site-2 protease family protein [Gaiellaceae bacterium]
MSGLTDDRELDRQDEYHPASYGGDLYNRLPPEDEHDLRGYEPIQPRGGLDVRGIARKLAAPFLAIAALVWKLKFAVFAVFKLKLFTTAATMLVSIGAYALLWPWQFAIGFVLLLFVHELGHVIEARRQGLPTSAPMFIPFLGALITLKKMPEDAWKEAQVALAGPIVGSIGAAFCLAAGVALDSDLLRALAFFGFLINLFNLLPVYPLDGGRAVEALHPIVWVVGLAGLVALTLIAPNPVLILVLLFGGFTMWERWQNRNHPERQAFYRIKGWQRIVVAIVYLGLAAVLGIAADLTHLQRDI